MRGLSVAAGFALCVGCGGLVANEDATPGAGSSSGGDSNAIGGSANAGSSATTSSFATLAGASAQGGHSATGGSTATGGAGTGGSRDHPSGGVSAGGTTAIARTSTSRASGGTTWTGNETFGGSASGGAANGGTGTNNTTRSDTYAVGGATTGGFTSSGGTATGGSSNDAGNPELQAYFDGQTLDVRLSLDVVTQADGSLQDDIVVALRNLDARDYSEGYRAILLHPNEAPPRLQIDLTGADHVSVDACRSVQLDAGAHQLRIQVPGGYTLGAAGSVMYPYGAASGQTQWSVSVQTVQRLPSFAGTPIDCSKNLPLAVGQRQFTQLIGIVDVNSRTRGCALDTAGEIACWQYPPQEALVIASGPFVQIAMMAPLQMCGLRSTGDVDCFRLAGDTAELGPMIVPDAPAKRLSEFGNCAILSDSSLYCWPLTAGGTSVASDEQFVNIAGTSDRGCAIRENGSLFCWESESEMRMPFELLDDVYRDISIRGGYACALTIEGEVDCITPNLPTRKVRFADGPYQRLGGAWAHCATDAAGHATCFGRFDALPRGSFAQLALGEFTDPPCGLLLDGRLAWWNSDGITLP